MLAGTAAATAALAGCGVAGPTGRIDHPTGATTVILRLDEGGGLVPAGFFVTEAPAFSLYGDGTAIFRDPAAPPPPAIGSVVRGAPFQVVRLSEDEVQALLAFALGPGSLGIAREQYQLPVADAPTTTFTIVAGGRTRTVSVNGLSVGAPAGSDAAVLEALRSVRERLMGFGATVTGETAWLPDRYRGILMEPYGDGDQPGSPIAWPWASILPTDFTTPSDPNAPRQWPTRVMTTAEVAALGVGGLEGGAQGFLLRRPQGSPGGMPYEFAVRPLLPDEAS
jgi:hypothetical protein